MGPLCWPWAPGPVVVVAEVLPMGWPSAQMPAVRLWVCIKGLARKQIRVRGLSGLPAPLRCPPPVLGSLVGGADGLPRTRNWTFRWPLPPASSPQVIDTQGNVSRQAAGQGGGFGGGWSCTSAATRGQRALLRFFNSSGLVKRAVPGTSWRSCVEPPPALDSLRSIQHTRPWGLGESPRDQDAT
jgi:hypothetical protein